MSYLPSYACHGKGWLKNHHHTTTTAHWATGPDTLNTLMREKGVETILLHLFRLEKDSK